MITVYRIDPNESDAPRYDIPDAYFSAADLREFSGSGLGVFEDVERLARVVKWTGIGVLTLAGAVVLFKVADAVFGD